MITYLIQNDLASNVMKKMKYWKETEATLNSILEIFRPYMFYIKQTTKTASIRSPNRRDAILPLRTHERNRLASNSQLEKRLNTDEKLELESKSQILTSEMLMKYKATGTQKPKFSEYVKSFMPKIYEHEDETLPHRK